MPQVMKAYPNSCGEHAWAAIAPTKRLFAAARAAGLAVFYSTGDARPQSQPKNVRATRRQRGARRPRALRDPPRVQAAAGGRGDHQGASERVLRHAARRAPHAARRAEHHRLRRKHLGLRARERGRRLFPRFSRDAGRGMLLRPQPLSHKVNLFDMHHKYADVLHVDEVVAHLERCGPGHDGAPRRQGRGHHGRRPRHRQGLRARIGGRRREDRHRRDRRDRRRGGRREPEAHGLRGARGENRRRRPGERRGDGEARGRGLREDRHTDQQRRNLRHHPDVACSLRRDRHRRVGPHDAGEPAAAPGSPRARWSSTCARTATARSSTSARAPR